MEPELKKYYINRAFKYLFRNLANWLLTNSGLESFKYDVKKYTFK